MTTETDNTDNGDNDDDDDDGCTDYQQLTPHPENQQLIPHPGNPPSDPSRKLSTASIGDLSSETASVTMSDGRTVTRDIGAWDMSHESDPSVLFSQYEEDFYLQETAEDTFVEADIPDEDLSSIWMSLFPHIEPSTTGEELGHLVIHLSQEGWEKHTDELVLALYCAHKDFEIMNTGEVYAQDTGEGFITSMKTDTGWTDDRFLPLDDLLSIKEYHSVTNNKFEHRTE